MAKAVSAQAKMLALAADKAGVRGRAKAAEQETVAVNGRTLTRDQALALHRAADLAKGGAYERVRAAALVREVERDIAQASEADAVAEGVAETVALQGGKAAGLRREVAVEASFLRDERGGLVRNDGELIVRLERVKRMRRDDGLANLLSSGALTSKQFAVGQLYRVTMAKASPSSRSSLCERESGGASGGSDAAIWSSLDRAYAALRLRLVREAVGDECAYALLNAVAGHGKTIRSLGSTGRAAIADAKKLAAALDVAERWLGISDAQLKKAVAIRER